MRSKFSRRIKAAALASAIILAAMPLSGVNTVYADEAVAEGEAVADEAAAAEGAVEGEALDGEFTDDALLDEALFDQGSSGGVTPGTILANNGLYIANTFPDELMPAGFHRQTVAYQGQNIDLAYMNSSDMVVLAYLTDVTGAVGDFYLCDTATATMSDYVKLDGANGTFLVVLDPGDNINAPAGFTKTTAFINNKNVTAWTVPDGSSSSKDKDEDKDASIIRITETVYAADLGLGIGAGENSSDVTDIQDQTGATVVDNSYVDGTTVDTGTYTDVTATDDVAAAQAAEAAAAAVVTDAAGFVKAQPSEFYLLYGVDYNGAQGFFLYDTLGQTYQRYLEIDTGESETTAKYRKSAQTRLFVIAGLILFSVVLIFIIINMALGGKRGSRNYEEDGGNDDVRRRVKNKERRNISNASGRRYVGDDDYYDEDEDDNGRNGYGRNRNVSGYEDEDEDIRYYDKGSQHTGRGVVRNGSSGGMQGRSRDPFGDISQSRPKIRTEMRSNVRMENGYSSGDDGMGYGPGQDTGDMGWNNMDVGSDYGNSGQGYDNNPGGIGRAGAGQQDIDLDDDFNFDFIKPGNK